MPKDIFEFVKQEEAAYALPITIPGTDWEWNMKEHIRLSILYKHSQFAQGNTDKDREDKPFRNIVRPVLNVQYRTEGFDVKDIVLYVDDEDQYYKSFLVKKYHDGWATKWEIDTFIDDVNESIVDLGGALVRDVNKKCPENIPLQTIAFCDQTNMLSGPLGIKHFYSPDELMSFESVGWGDTAHGANVSLRDAIIFAKTEKILDSQSGKSTKTPGKYVECYEVNGVLPESWLKQGGDPEKFVRQMQILMFYWDETSKQKKGLILFRGRQADGLFKVMKRDKIHGRALGYGGVEELFDPQVWANYNEIVMKDMLDAASKVILKTTDAQVKQKHPNGLKDMESLELVEVEDGKDIGQVNTTPVSFGLFEKKVNEWDAIARTLGGASDVLLGENPTSGEPFKTTNLVTQESHGLHDYRRGKYAVFMGKVYTDYVLKHLMEDITEGKKFLETLSMKELQQVIEAMVVCQVNDIKKEKMLNGEEIVPADMAQLEAGIRKNFAKKGSDWFLEIFKDEMRDVPTVVKVNVAGKQKDLAKITDKIVNVIRQVIAAPQILNDPRMAQLFNEIIELSGLSPLDFSQPIAQNALPPAAQPTPSPIQPSVVPNQDVAPVQ